MRLAVIILALAGIGVAFVHIRRVENVVRHEIQDLQSQQVRLRREKWDRQLRAGLLSAPDAIRHRAMDEMSLDLVDKYQPPTQPSLSRPVVRTSTRPTRGR